MTTLSQNAPQLEAESLVHRHLSGDPSAFGQIVEQNEKAVCAVTFSGCGDVARSEDLAQEVFVTAWHKLPELREPARLRAWLCGIARNLVYNTIRRDGRIPTARADALSPETPAEGEGPRERAISAEESALLWSALERVPDNYREPLVLFYRDQQSTHAVAEALDLTEETVRQRLARGRALLSEQIAAIVTEKLSRSGPGPAFTRAVLAAVPTGAAAAKGGMAMKLSATAGGIAAPKGGIAIKALSGFGLLPMFLSGLLEFLHFRTAYEDARLPDVRRQIARHYFELCISTALLMLVMAGGTGRFYIDRLFCVV